MGEDGGCDADGFRVETRDDVVGGAEGGEGGVGVEGVEFDLVDCWEEAGGGGEEFFYLF